MEQMECLHACESTSKSEQDWERIFSDDGDGEGIIMS
jgi:hypothetical protein